MNTRYLHILLLFITTTFIYTLTPHQDYEEYKLKKTELINSGTQQQLKHKSNINNFKLTNPQNSFIKLLKFLFF